MGTVHVPVLLEPVLELIGRALEAHAARGEEPWIVDATVGAGGHAGAILARFERARVLGLDQDPHVLAFAQRGTAEYGARATLRHGRFSGLLDALAAERVPGPAAILGDLGASSLQLDAAERGFSFQADGPLDMRMDPGRDRSAADIVNRWDEDDLADLFYYEGGEPRARAIARAIAEARVRAPFRRTLALAALVERAVGGRHGRIHPATRVFQALRRAVNDEGDELEALLAAAETALPEGGALLVISFHSGEDGIVKRFLAEGARAGTWEPLTRKPIEASSVERRANPRARSAKLRAALRRRAPRGGAG